MADLDPEAARAAAERDRRPDVAVGVAVDVTDAGPSPTPSGGTLLAFGGIDLVVNNAGLSVSKPLLETTEEDWDLQHDVMAKGSFLVAKAAAAAMVAQDLGGDIVYIVSKNAVFAGPNNVAYGSEQGRPGPSGAAARGRAGRTRHQGQRREPRRRRPRQRHLRRRVGRRPRRGLRRGRGGAWRVLRAAQPAQARGAARARGGGGRRHQLDEFSHTTGLLVPVDCGRGRRVPALGLAMAPSVFAAVDLGASGGRVMAGLVEGGALSLDAVHRFPNGARRGGRPAALAHRPGSTKRSDRLACWPSAIRRSSRSVSTPGASTTACSTPRAGCWPSPLVPRRPHGQGRRRVHAVVPPDELFARNGLQFLPFTTIYQLAERAPRPAVAAAAALALLPDLLAYWLTGELRTERTNASTTGLLDVRTGDGTSSSSSASACGGVAPPLVSPGTVLGPLRAELRERLGLPGRRRGHHGRLARHRLGRGRACPPPTDRFAYISSGTWSLVGVDWSPSRFTEAARRENFTNEGGVDGRIRFLRNTGGLWLLQESLRDRAERGEELDPALSTRPQPCRPASRCRRR